MPFGLGYWRGLYRECPELRQGRRGGAAEHACGRRAIGCAGGGVSGGVKPRINGEQHAPGTTRCSAGRQWVTSRQAATRLLRCAPALQVTRRNP